MKFSSVSDAFFDLCYFDKELLFNEDERRPYLIILRLKYKSKNHDFAVPFRSNIANYIPKDQYFSLPPRHTTKKEKIHGLHYIKMFPIIKEFLIKFNVNEDRYYRLISNIISKNIKQIVVEAQQYLINYQNGERCDYCTDIDGIMDILYKYQQSRLIINKTLEEAALFKENNNIKISD